MFLKSSILKVDFMQENKIYSIKNETKNMDNSSIDLIRKTENSIHLNLIDS